MQENKSFMAFSMQIEKSVSQDSCLTSRGLRRSVTLSTDVSIRISYNPLCFTYQHMDPDVPANLVTLRDSSVADVIEPLNICLLSVINIFLNLCAFGISTCKRFHNAINILCFCVIIFFVLQKIWCFSTFNLFRGKLNSECHFGK